MNTFFYLVAIEPNGGNGIFFECAVGDGLDESGLAGVLEPDDGYFEFLIEEFGLEPAHDFIEESHHGFPSDNRILIYIIRPAPKITHRIRGRQNWQQGVRNPIIVWQAVGCILIIKDSIT